MPRRKPPAARPKGRSQRRPPRPPPRPAAAGPQAFTLEVGGRLVLVLAADAAAPGPPLSPAERAVAEQLLAGETNAAIAQRRGTSVRTIANQVARIFRKLGVGSRAELAARGLPRDPPPR